MSRILYLTASMCTVSVLILWGCGGLRGDQALSEEQMACEALMGTGNLTITSARLLAATEMTPQYYYVKGIISAAIVYHVHIHNGGKMILYTGWADPSPPAATLIDYYNDIADTTFPGDLDATKEHTRLFLVPGMGHCRGGRVPKPGINWLHWWIGWKTAMHLILSLPPTAPMGSWTTNGGSVPTRSWLCTRAPPGVKTILPIG